MPIYEFECKDCFKESEILTHKSEWMGHINCPSCGSSNLEKKLSVFATSSQEISNKNFDSSPCSGIPTNCGRCSLEN